MKKRLSPGVRRGLPCLVLAFAACGCGLVPEHPPGFPLGVRSDHGSLTVLIPRCPGDQVISAGVYELSASDPPAAWTGRVFKGGGQEVRLDPRAWASVVGSYASVSNLSIEVRTGRNSFGTNVRRDLLLKNDNMPTDTYLVDGRRTSKDQFNASRTGRKC